jgi:copper chaperone CopZ
MSMLPAVRVTFDKKLNDVEFADIQKKVSSIPGVLSAHFNAKSKEALVTYEGSKVRQEIQNIPGVVSVKHQF